MAQTRFGSEMERRIFGRELAIGFVLILSSLSVAGCFEGYVGPDQGDFISVMKQNVKNLEAAFH